jgi:hypothetical protein
MVEFSLTKLNYMDYAKNLNNRIMNSPIKKINITHKPKLINRAWRGMAGNGKAGRGGVG